MEVCPLCQSASEVNPGKPCYFCDCALVITASRQAAAVVPSSVLFDLSKPESAAAAIQRLSLRTRYVVLDLSELRLLSSEGLQILLAVQASATRHEVRLVLAAARPNVIRMLQIFNLRRAFRVMRLVDDALGEW